MKRELIIPLSSISKIHPTHKHFLDVDTEKTESNYQITFTKRSIANTRTLLGRQTLTVRMTKPEIQHLVSELTKILLFDE